MIPVHAPVSGEVLHVDIDLDAFHLDNPDIFQGVEGFLSDDFPEAGVFQQGVSAFVHRGFNGHLTEGLLVNVLDLNLAKIIIRKIKAAQVSTANFCPGFCPGPAGFRLPLGPPERQ